MGLSGWLSSISSFTHGHFLSSLTHGGLVFSSVTQTGTSLILPVAMVSLTESLDLQISDILEGPEDDLEDPSWLGPEDD